jgi:hypothetical protein
MDAQMHAVLIVRRKRKLFPVQTLFPLHAAQSNFIRHGGLEVIRIGVDEGLQAAVSNNIAL